MTTWPHWLGAMTVIQSRHRVQVGFGTLIQTKHPSTIRQKAETKWANEQAETEEKTPSQEPFLPNGHFISCEISCFNSRVEHSTKSVCACQLPSLRRLQHVQTSGSGVFRRIQRNCRFEAVGVPKSTSLPITLHRREIPCV